MNRRESVWAVMLSWNGREDTLACLRTLKAQTRRPDTILVIDNGSTDGLEPAVRREFPEVAYWALERNLGFAGGMNVGLRRALEQGADYIVTPNNDTFLDPRCLERLLAALEAEPQAGAAAPKIYLEQPAGTIYFNGGFFSRATLKPTHPGENRLDPNPDDRTVREISFLNGCCPLFRGRALRAVGLFHEPFFAYFEDADLSLRLRAAGWRLLLVPEARVIHRSGVSFQRNAGPAAQGTVSPWKWFLLTRNRLWLLRMHGRWWQLTCGVPFVIVSRLLIAVVLTLRGRPRKSVGILRGLWAGMTAAWNRSILEP